MVSVTRAMCSHLSRSAYGPQNVVINLSSNHFTQYDNFSSFVV